MDEQPHQRTILVIAGLLVGGAILASSVLVGGRASTVLSTVGSAIGDATSGGAVTSGGSTSGSDDSDPGSGPGPGSTSGGTGSGAAGQVADAAAAVPTLLIVRTGELHLEVADLLAAIRDADATVIRAGGYVSGSNRTADAADQSAEVTYRIPSAAWQPTLDALHGLAAKVGAEQVKTEEVTGQVVDLTARIANLRATEAALQAIMARATKISDVLDVQGQLTTTRGEIEKLVADKQHLEDRASYGSLTVTFQLPAKVVPPATPKPARGWDPADDVARATDRLVGIGQASTTVGIWLAIVGLPLLVAGTILAAVAWQLYRLARWLIRRHEDAMAPGG